MGIASTATSSSAAAVRRVLLLLVVVVVGHSREVLLVPVLRRWTCSRGWD
jgi:hypothetical protein